jgi:hypothetical protein
MGRTLFNAYTQDLVEERKIIEDGALSIVQDYLKQFCCSFKNYEVIVIDNILVKNVWS